MIWANFKIKLTENKWLLYVVFITIISVNIYSASHGIFFDSDNALHVLMIERFEFFKDNFIWGETYLGSLFPMIGNVIKRITGINGLLIATFVQYVFIFSSIFFISKTYFKTPVYRIALAISILVPPISFAYLNWVAHPYLSSMAPVFASIYYLITYIKNIEEKSSFRYLAIYAVFTFLSAWVVELYNYLNYITSLLLFGYIVYYKYKKIINTSQFVESAITLFLSLISIPLILTFLKKNNVSTYVNESFLQINNFSEIKLIISSYWNIFIQAVIFQNLLVGIYTWLFLSSLVFIFIYLGLSKTFRKYINIENLILLYFLFAYVGAIIVSHRTIFSGVSVRYLCPAYVFLIVLVLHNLEVIGNRISGIYSKYLSIAAICFTMMGALTVAIPYLESDCNTCSAQQLSKEMERVGLEKINIIGDYWYAYKYSGATSFSVTSTPSDVTICNYRDLKTRYKVVESKYVFVPLNNWFSEFPDSIWQYGVCFKKTKDKRIKIDDWGFDFVNGSFPKVSTWFQKYENVSITDKQYKKTISSNNCVSWSGTKKVDSTVNLEVWELELDKIVEKKDFIYTTTGLVEGNYKANIVLWVDNPDRMKDGVELIISNRDSHKLLSSVKVPKDSLKNGWKAYEVSFSILEEAMSMDIQLFVSPTKEPCVVRFKEIELIKND